MQGKLNLYSKKSIQRVIALDMRGYGDSDKPKGVSAYKLDLLTRDIFDFVKALQKDKCILVGHDWGGFVAWSVAGTYPEIVDKLVILNSPHPGAFQAKIEKSLKQFVKSWYELYFQSAKIIIFNMKILSPSLGTYLPSNFPIFRNSTFELRIWKCFVTFSRTS